eukprot:1218867-Rhodomonas_salina.1
METRGQMDARTAICGMKVPSALDVVRSAHTPADRETHNERDREIERQRERQRERERKRERERETERQTETERQRDRHTDPVSSSRTPPLASLPLCHSQPSHTDNTHQPLHASRHRRNNKLQHTLTSSATSCHRPRAPLSLANSDPRPCAPRLCRLASRPSRRPLRPRATAAFRSGQAACCGGIRRPTQSARRRRGRRRCRAGRR